MKQKKVLISPIIIITLFIVTQSCSFISPETKNTPLKATDSTTPLENFERPITIEDLACDTRLNCSTKHNSFTSQSETYNEHPLPSSASIRVERDGFLVYFTWGKPAQNTTARIINSPFSQGQAWIFKILMRDNDFGYIRDPYEYYTDFITNLPCAFKHYNYARHMEKDEFEEKLHTKCTLSKKQIRQERLYDIKRLHERYMIRSGHSFNIGSMCPENITIGRRYFILFRYHPSIRSETRVSIASLLTEDSFNLELRYASSEKHKKRPPINDCPYLITDSDMLIRGKLHSCGRYNDKSWINDLPVPIKNHRFIPGNHVRIANRP